MSVWRLITREIGHRKLNFLLGLLSVMAAVACLIGAQFCCCADRVVTERLLTEKQAEVEEQIAAKRQAVEQAGAELEDAMRKHMLQLGFNVLILPADQPLSELHLDGTLSATMPEAYVDRLASSNIVTVNHLLPSVTRRIAWPEQQRDIILVGTRGEVPIMHRGMKKPLLDAVAPGKMVVGYRVHQELGLAEGDTVQLLGREFTISTLHPERGSTDDVTVWIDLRAAQELLGMENLINAILALECECAGDRIAQIRAEIAGILPGTQVIERDSQAVTRAEARTKAKEAADAALAQEVVAGETLLAREEQGRLDLEQKHARLAAILVPLTLGGSSLLIGLLAFVNARQRREEIGLLRAIGLQARQILTVFLGKAALIGVAGGVLGCLAGLLLFRGFTPPELFAEVARSPDVLRTILAALLLCAAARHSRKLDPGPARRSAGPGSGPAG